MELRTEPIQDPIRRSYGHSRLSPLVAVAVYAAVVAGGVWFLSYATDGFTGWGQGGLTFIAALFLAVVMYYLPDAVRLVTSTYSSSNWVLKLADDALYLNPRSFQDPSPAPGSVVAVRIGFDEVQSVRRVAIATLVDVEEIDHEFDHLKDKRRFLELELRDADTTALARWLQSELDRAPRVRRLGYHLFRHQPLRVTGPRALLFEEQAGMLAALEQRLHVGAPTRRTETASHESYA